MPDASAAFPSVRCRHCSLRPTTPEYLELLDQEALEDEDLWFRVWGRGLGSPSGPPPQPPESGNPDLTIIAGSDRQPVGRYVAVRPGPWDDHAFVSGFVVSHFRGTRASVAGVALFLRHVFAVLPISKVYFEVPEYNASQILYITREILVTEVVFRDRIELMGRTWDMSLLSLSRERFDAKVRSTRLLAP